MDKTGKANKWPLPPWPERLDPIHLWLIVLAGAVVVWLAVAAFDRGNPKVTFPYEGPPLTPRLRTPAYAPEGLVHRGLTVKDPFVMAEGQGVPYAVEKWGLPSGYPDLLLIFAALGKEVEPGEEITNITSLSRRVRPLDPGGTKTPVQIDGVQGWLWRLGPGDLIPPSQPGVEFASDTDWERRIYVEIARLRQPKQAFYNGLEGDAIAVQWNKDGVHYIIIGTTKEPITEEELLKMANSLSPVDPSKLPPPTVTAG